MRQAKPRSKELLGTLPVITKGQTKGSSGLTTTQLQLLKNLSDWFGYDEDSKSVFVKKDAQGLPRNFYCFGEVTGGGITANNGGIAPSGMRAILIDGQPYISSDVQTPLDICAGSNVTITKNGNGRITIAANGGGSSVSWGSSGLGFAYLNVGGDSRKLITEHQDISNKITSPSTSGGAGKFLQWNGSAYVLASQAWREIKVNNVSFLAANVSNALNLIAGSNITLTRNTNGRVTISADDAGSSVSWGEEGSGYVNLSVDGTSKTLITEHQDVSDKITSPDTTGATGKFLQWGGSEYIFASQTWRAVNVGGESLLSGSNDTALNLVAGNNISLTKGVLGQVVIASTGLTQEQKTAINNFIAWFGYDEETNSVFVRKDAQGNARNFYCFGEVTGGGITAGTGGGGGTGDYNNLLNRPKINNVTLAGNMTLATLGIAAANHTHSQYLTASALDGFLPKTGGTLTRRLTINDSISTKPLILNTTYEDADGNPATNVLAEFQVGGTPVGTFEYGLDTAWLKLFISDAHGTGIAIGGTNNGQATYGRLLYIQNYSNHEVYHAGNSNKSDVDWQGRNITAAGKFVGNKWYPSANDTTHYIEFADGHWTVHGDLVCTGEIAAGQITG